MSYHPRGRSLTRACWRDGRGALRCKRPDGIGDDDDTTLNLPGSAANLAKVAKVTPEDFLIANLNRFKGEKAPTGQSLGETKLPAGTGINDQVAFDALTVVIRRLGAGVAAITADGGARQLLSDARALLGAGDATGLGGLVKYVKSNVNPIGAQVAAFGDALGLPPAKFPLSVAGISGLKLFAAAGALGAVALFFMTRRTP